MGIGSVNSVQFSVISIPRCSTPRKMSGTGGAGSGWVEGIQFVNHILEHMFYIFK
jgi:hypothetical protein